MHAFGHDGHKAMVLGASKDLAETRNFDGTAVVIFQPAEEGGGGGREMCAEGMMALFGIQEVYGMHNMPGFPVGHFAIRPGAMLASSDSWEVTFKGTGGHGAMPDRGTDPTFVAAQFIVAVQGIIGRNVSSSQAAVLSVGHIAAGTAGSPNVIPSEVLIRGTARSFYIGVGRSLGTERAVCVAPRGLEDGQSVKLDRTFVLLTNRPVSFRLFSSTTREDLPGAIVSAGEGLGANPACRLNSKATWCRKLTLPPRAGANVY